MCRTTVWVHVVLALYVVLLTAAPLGRWNAAGDDALVPALLRSGRINLADLIQCLFPLVPLALLVAALKVANPLLTVLAVMFDLVWACMHYLSWWAPYISGHAKAWQIAYARGATVKLLPSYGGHLAPDGMHLTIDILLAAALLTAAAALVPGRRKPASEGGVGQGATYVRRRSNR